MARRTSTPQGRRPWPFTAALPSVGGMSAANLTNLHLTERAAMNAVHTLQATHADIQTVLVGLAAGLDVAHRSNEDDIQELRPARVAIAEGLTPRQMRPPSRTRPRCRSSAAIPCCSPGSIALKVHDA